MRNNEIVLDEKLEVESSEIVTAWRQFCNIKEEKITYESKINKLKSLVNPFAMQEVALWYADMEYYTEDKIEKNYLKWILKVRKWIDEKYKDVVINSVACRKLLSWSYEAEGLIYSERKNDAETRQKAIKCLEKAEELSNYEKVLDVGVKIEFERDSVLNRLRRINRTEAYINSIQYRAFLSSLAGENLCEIREKAEKKAQELIGGEWNKLHVTSRKQIGTALFTLKVMEEANGENVFDYSAIVSLLSRALEYEIKIRFYKSYLEYLKDRIEVNDYITSNALSRFSEYKHRRLIIDSAENETGDVVVEGYHEYDKIGEKQFCLGATNYVIGFSNKSDESSIDITFIDFCRNFLWETEGSDEDIIKWITSICRNVLELSETRNHASHGGYNLQKNEAIQAFNEIIFIGKILVYLLKPCKDVHGISKVY